MNYHLLVYSFEVLNQENLKNIINDIEQIFVRKTASDDEKIYLGIYFENIKKYRLETFPVLKNISRQYQIEIIIFNVLAQHRIFYYLENIPVKIGCAFIKSF